MQLRLREPGLEALWNGERTSHNCVLAVSASRRPTTDWDILLPTGPACRHASFTLCGCCSLVIPGEFKPQYEIRILQIAMMTDGYSFSPPLHSAMPTPSFKLSTSASHSATSSSPRTIPYISRQPRHRRMLRPRNWLPSRHRVSPSVLHQLEQSQVPTSAIPPWAATSHQHRRPRQQRRMLLQRRHQYHRILRHCISLSAHCSTTSPTRPSARVSSRLKLS